MYGKTKPYSQKKKFFSDVIVDENFWKLFKKLRSSNWSVLGELGAGGAEIFILLGHLAKQPLC